VTVDPYTRLVQLAEAEHAALLEGDIESLEPINRERRQLIATLPVRAPEAARPALTEAARLQVRNHTLLEATKARIGARLTQNGRARDTARGYAKQVASAGPNFFRSA
jgi:hypothetical protein